MAPASISNELMASFHTNGATLGSLAAAYFYIYTAMQIPSGILSDTIGAKTTATTGNAVSGIGSLIFAFSDNIYSAGFGRLLVGLGVSVIFVSLMKSNTKWFDSRKYSFISGLTMFIGNLGSIISAGPLVIALSLFIWRDIFIFLGIISITLSILSYFFVTNDTGKCNNHNSTHKDQSPDYSHWLTELKNIIINPRIWPAFILNFGLTGSFFAFIGLWCIPYIKDIYHVNKETASLYTTISLIAFAFGSLLTGWISDRIKKRKVILVTGTSIYLLLWIFLRMSYRLNNSILLLVFFLLGFAASTFILTYSISKEQTSHNAAGMAISFVNTGLFLGAAIIQSLFGYILDQHWEGVMFAQSRIYSVYSYHEAINLIIMASAASFFSSLFLPKIRYKFITES
jgi:MFS family permease